MATYKRMFALLDVIAIKLSARANAIKFVVFSDKTIFPALSSSAPDKRLFQHLRRNGDEPHVEFKRTLDARGCAVKAKREPPIIIEAGDKRVERCGFEIYFEQLRRKSQARHDDGRWGSRRGV